MRLQYLNPRAPVFQDAAGQRTVVPMERLAAVPTASELTLSSFKAEQFNASIMLELGFSSMQGRSDSTYDFYMFAFSFASPMLSIENVQGIDRAFEYGTSARIAISVARTTATASLNLAGLAASASVQGVKSSVEAQFTGMDLKLSTRLGNYITLGAPFDATMMNNIGKMTADFQNSVATNPEWILPDRLSSADLISDAGGNYLQAISSAYAIHRITQGDTLQSALNRLSSKVSSNSRGYAYEEVSTWLTQAVYYQISGGDPFGPLASSTKTKAHQIYDNTQAT
ncbi:hypothetical protein [Pyxidicoccus sp. MSG2]|uniref:hypothetical protein n=1 Tax=Pyxidicoccus sp. MSG2 TaxID=2996790 RepID=UPI00227223ED|nr:hypothetical protein [Pyxidicoccus sp. MSG2]MCY1014529.1 hypothetical protein [Pyxidicoccus sp. MSG2]